MSLYNDKFYGDNISRIESSKEILSYLFKILRPNSVLDVGCGRGVWLKVSKDLGAKIIYGVDGEWNNGKQIDKEIVFKSINLNNNFDLNKKFDLTLCLEVVEHLEKNSSENIISSLTNTSDIILFSAAFKYQGGVGHLNENLHSYWADIFHKKNYLPFDLIRPVFWDNEKVSYWYRQNTFLYVKKNSPQFEKIKMNFNYIKNYKFMDSVHPEMFFRKIESQGLKYHLKQIFKNLKKRL